MTGEDSSILVWDRLVRSFHWLLVVGLLLAWASAEGWLRSHWHAPAGYAVIALLGLRLVQGFAGSHHARFAAFVRPPGVVFAYARLLAQRRAPRYIGHNPLGGWMVIALLSTTGFTAATGWLFSTDRYWGSDVMALAHQASAWTLLILAGVHICGVIVASIQHGENLPAAMISGRKAPPGVADVG